MKKLILNLWIFLGLWTEFYASKIGAIKHLDFLDMPRFTEIDNMGGTGTKFYFCLSDDVDTWPTAPDPASATLDVLQVYPDDFVMKTGKKFFVGYMTPDTGVLTNSDQGDIDGVSQKHAFKLFHPKMNAKLKGFLRATNNQGMVFIVPDGNGVMHVVGSEPFPALRAGDGESGSGEGTAGRSGGTMTFISYGPGPMMEMFAAAVIPITEAV